MPDEKLLVAKGIGVALAGRQVTRILTYHNKRLAAVCLFYLLLPQLADMFMDHASRVQRWMPANPTVPGIFVPC